MSKIAINSLCCATLEGVSASVIEVEATFTRGLPGFSVVGLASSDIQESKERVKSALLTNGFTFPPLKITLNLAPSGIKKSGTHFDLSIALLIASYKKALTRSELFVFGELGLDGKVKANSLIFPIILSLKEQGLIKKAMVPSIVIEPLARIPDIEFIPVDNLKDALDKLNTEEAKSYNYEFKGKRVEVGGKSYYYLDEYLEDFSDVKGQEIAKRGALIASAGGHNILMQGSPGCGKSMIAKRIRYILPPLSKEEILTIAKYQFLDSKEPDFKPLRPFRSPHHSATSASIFGGGSFGARIGEVALANYGVLFFDELPHFPKNILEALREPLQDYRVNIARVHSKVSYEANFIFIGAMNPCPCGNLLSATKNCRCSDREIQRYKNRLSEPFLDRIDIFITMQEVAPEDKSSFSSRELHKMVIEAFKFQKARGQKSLNGKMGESEIKEYCNLADEANAILSKAISKFNLSWRSIASIKKVARTIADLDLSRDITKKHILEALSYRRRD